MKRQFVSMTNQGAKAYYIAQKTQRKEAAEWYRDHPEMLLSGVAEKFKLPMSSMRKGLIENGIETDRGRQYGRHQRRLLCPDCGERVHHVCKDQSEMVVAVKQKQSKKGYVEKDPRFISPSGKPIPRTPESIAYLATAPIYQHPDEPRSNYLPGDTPEQKALADLGWEGLFERGRKDLGIK